MSANDGITAVVTTPADREVFVERLISQSVTQLMAWSLRSAPTLLVVTCLSLPG